MLLDVCEMVQRPHQLTKGIEKTENSWLQCQFWQYLSSLVLPRGWENLEVQMAVFMVSVSWRAELKQLTALSFRVMKLFLKNCCFNNEAFICIHMKQSLQAWAASCRCSDDSRYENGKHSLKNSLGWFGFSWPVGSCLHLNQAEGRNVGIITSTFQDSLPLWVGGGYKGSFLEHSRVTDVLWGLPCGKCGMVLVTKAPPNVLGGSEGAA